MVADFAARVAKLASESPIISIEKEKSSGASPIGGKETSQMEVVDCADIEQFEVDLPLTTEKTCPGESVGKKSDEVEKGIIMFRMVSSVNVVELTCQCDAMIHHM